MIKAFLICFFRKVISIVVILTFSKTTMGLKEKLNPEEILGRNISSCGFRYNNYPNSCFLCSISINIDYSRSLYLVEMFSKIFVTCLQFHYFFLARSNLLITRRTSCLKATIAKSFFFSKTALRIFLIWHIEYGIHKLKTFGSSVKWSDPGHFLKAQGKFFSHFHVPLFYIFLTPKNYKLSL